MVLLVLRDLLKVQSEIPYRKFQQSQFKRAYIGTSLVAQWLRLHQNKTKQNKQTNQRAYMINYTYVNNQAKFIKSQNYFASKLVLSWPYLVEMKVILERKKLCFSGY